MNLADILESAGFESLEAGSAAEAETVLKGRPDVSLLVTDIKMPGALDGLDLAQHVSAALPRIKIVVISGHADMADARIPSAAKFIRKPYTVARLFAAIG
jgi:DNA-binding NtrC family response regulator